MEDIRFTSALYTLKEAAYHLNMNSRTLGHWADKDNLLTTVNPETPRGARLPFIALVEAQLYFEFKRSGLSMLAIASGMQEVRKHLGSNMLKKGKLAHDGKNILMDLADKSDTPEWTRARDLQIAIPKIIDEGLRLITWDEAQYPQSVRLTAYGSNNIVADYRFAFGRPIIKGTRIRAEDITQPFKAGETLENICAELSIDLQTAESVIRAHLAIAA
jgi:uncharacterized protein (DUF433 family)